MAESVRELVVTMSLEAGNFSKTCTDINAQIKGVEAQFNAITSGVGNWQSTMEGRNAKLAALNETLGLQEQKIATIRTELDKATAALAADPTLANAKKVSGLETQLNNAKTAAANTKAEIEKINLIKFTEFSNKMTTLGNSLKTFGRKFSMYIGGPLAALGIKSFNLAQDYETAMTRLQIASQATDEEIAVLNDTILQMSGEIPVSYTEIADLMKTLSEAGVPIENLKSMVLQIEALKATSDITDENVTDMIRFMKIMNVPLEDIDNLSSALFSLGINSVATSGEIFAMANRMAATGALAGFSAQEVLALATAYTSMGINAEAGGTASNKLMKEFQLAAETGKGASASLEQLAGVIGITTDEFKSLQTTDPAGLMLKFFDSLSQGGAEGNASVLALLDSLGITESRVSALVAAAANNPNFFAEMLDGSVTAWNDTTAAVEATEKAYGTSEANTTKSLNLMENAAADAGTQIVNQMQPLITVIGNLATEFSKLDDATQSRWVALAGGLILFGPAVGFVGTLAKDIGSLVGHLIKIDANGVSNWSKLIGVFNNPVALGVAAGGALYLAVDYLATQIPSALDLVATKAKDIPINLDKTKVDELQKVIDETQAKFDKLRGGETTQEGENTTTAVKMGLGTDNMFAAALGYEESKLQAQTNGIISGYAAKIAEIEAAIVANPTDLGNAERLAEIETLKGEMGRALEAAKTAFTTTVSEMFNGMTSAMGAGASDLKRAAALYDLYAIVYDEMTNGAKTARTEQEVANKYKEINQKAIALGFEAPPGGLVGADLLWLAPEIGNKMNEVVEVIGTQGHGMDLLQAVLNDTEAVAGLDVSKIEGALDGALATVDWKAAATKADGEGDFGQYLTQGLAQGVTSNTATVTNSMVTLKDETVAALLAAFQMQSPSRLMAAQGINIPAGVAVGILNGIPLAANAMNALGAAISAIAAAQGAAAGAAYGGAFGKTASASFSVALGKIRKELTALENRISTGYGSHYNVGGR